MIRIHPKRQIRGQAPIESLFALALLLIAAGGAWKLYGAQIQATNEAMVETAKELFGAKPAK